MLINNVGIGYDHPEYFAELAEDKVDAMMRCNMDSVTRMTRLVLPGVCCLLIVLFDFWGRCRCFGAVPRSCSRMTCSVPFVSGIR